MLGVDMVTVVDFVWGFLVLTLFFMETVKKIIRMNLFRIIIQDY